MAPMDEAVLLGLVFGAVAVAAVRNGSAYSRAIERRGSWGAAFGAGVVVCAVVALLFLAAVNR
jgi:hypothetical protein